MHALGLQQVGGSRHTQHNGEVAVAVQRSHLHAIGQHLQGCTCKAADAGRQAQGVRYPVGSGQQVHATLGHAMYGLRAQLRRAQACATCRHASGGHVQGGRRLTCAASWTWAPTNSVAPPLMSWPVTFVRYRIRPPLQPATSGSFRTSSQHKTAAAWTTCCCDAATEKQLEFQKQRQVCLCAAVACSVVVHGAEGGDDSLLAVLLHWQGRVRVDARPGGEVLELIQQGVLLSQRDAAIRDNARRGRRCRRRHIRV